MKCPRCQTENDDRLRFCEECGAPLTRACPNCGAQIRPGKKFCGECGFALDTSPTSRFAFPQQYTPKHLAERILLSKEALEGERKQVTVLFADMKGSMERLADRDPERQALANFCPDTFDEQQHTTRGKLKSAQRRSVIIAWCWQQAELL